MQNLVFIQYQRNTDTNTSTFYSLKNTLSCRGSNIFVYRSERAPDYAPLSLCRDSISRQLNMCLCDDCSDSRDGTTPEQHWGGAKFAIQDVKGVVFQETCH